VLLCLALIYCRRFVGDEEANREFDKFVKKHKREYGSDSEKEVRRVYFRDTYKFIQSYNDVSDSAKLEINKFADLSPEEAKSLTSLKTTNLPIKEVKLTNGTNTTIDWRARGAVTPVKDQARCGSCWAFSAVGALEGCHFIKTGVLASFSEQFLVNCDGEEYGNFGCSGGFMQSAFEFVKIEGIPLESDVPYTGTDGNCTDANKSFKISGWAAVPPNDNDQLLMALNKGPVSIGITAANPVFMFYQSGIISQNCGNVGDQIDHGVTLVGAGVQNDTAYWIVNNSWGPKWGQNGYVYIKRDQGQGPGQCGIAMSASYPIA